MAVLIDCFGIWYPDFSSLIPPHEYFDFQLFSRVVSCWQKEVDLIKKKLGKSRLDKIERIISRLLNYLFSSSYTEERPNFALRLGFSSVSEAKKNIIKTIIAFEFFNLLTSQVIREAVPLLVEEAKKVAAKYSRNLQFSCCPLYGIRDKMFEAIRCLITAQTNLPFSERQRQLQGVIKELLTPVLPLMAD